MANKTIALEIVTQEKVLFSGEVESITAPGAEGELTILPHHAALFCQLDFGELHYTIDNRVENLIVSNGFLHVTTDNKVVVIVDSAKTARDISLDKAEAAIKAAKQTMLLSEDKRELLLAEAALKLALLEIRVAQRSKRNRLWSALALWIKYDILIDRMKKSKPSTTNQDMTQPILDQVELTKEGLAELQQELLQLEEVKLPEAIERVSTAREHGDLSENSEYHSARSDKELIETRIDEIQSVLEKAIVVTSTKSHLKVGIGSSVTVKKQGDKKNKTYTIVGEYESDPQENKISAASPLGKALIGKKPGDKVMVKAPSGEVEYTIIEIK